MKTKEIKAIKEFLNEPNYPEEFKVVTYPSI